MEIFHIPLAYILYLYSIL